MHRNLFDKRIRVQKKHSIEELSGLEDVLEFLEDWPEHGRDLAFETLHAACIRALHRDFPLAAVRHNFERFLARAEMLVDEDQRPA